MGRFNIWCIRRSGGWGGVMPILSVSEASITEEDERVVKEGDRKSVV